MCALQLPKDDATDLIAGCPYISGAVTGGSGGGCPHQAQHGMTTQGIFVGLPGLFLVGLNHHTAEVGLREKFFTEQLELMLAELRGLGLSEVAVLFTCNRIEVLGSGGGGGSGGGLEGAEAVIKQFATRCGMPVEQLRPHLYVATGQDAALHLMRVAAGLESVVLGEAQILGQVAEAATRAHAAGVSGPLLSRVFGAAVAAGKRARTETGISRHTLSISHAGVMLAKAARSDFSSARVLIIGAGEMAKLAISAVRAHEGGEVTVINRTPNRAQILAEESGVRHEPWNRLHEALLETDIVIAATSSPIPVIHSTHLEGRRTGMTLVDLGVPRNIDRSVTQVKGVTLHDVDDLQQVVEQHRIQRQREVAGVEAILEEEMDALLEQLRSVELAPVITGLRRKVESVITSELSRTLAQLQGIDAETRATLELMAHRISSKLLHAPTVALRSTNGNQIAPTVCEIFDLKSSTFRCGHCTASPKSAAPASVAKAQDPVRQGGAVQGAPGCPYGRGARE